MKSIKKYLLISIGFLSLALGIIGVFFPVLPTTPFLLLTSFCFVRSSTRLYHWLINHKLFGTYIYNYMTYKAVKKSTKVGALLFLWASLIVSMIIIDQMYLRILLLVIGTLVSIHILSLKVLNAEEFDESKLEIQIKKEDTN
ncbi:MAG: uncharacterized protein K0S71_167 [Clostridia bacterium]|jgi:uncharacterized membrane protein YbaN (DUF454 family)|nr:uncharacterized protein [Clostridia bacterium]